MQASVAASNSGARGTTKDRKRTWVRALDSLCFWAIIGGLAFAPFWFGGNLPLAWGIHAIWFAGVTVAYEIGRLAAARRRPIALRKIWIPVACVVVTAIWAAMQITPGMPGAYQHPVWQMASEALGRPVVGAISINPDETAIALLKLTTAACLFWTTMQLCRDSNRARNLIAAIAAIGALYALYGVIAFFAFPKTILWYPKIFYNDSVTSTFINRNSYATYAGIGLIAAIAMASQHFMSKDREGGRAVKRRIASLVAAASGGGGAWLAAAFIIGIALILTISRGGISATLGGVIALAAMVSLRGRKNAAGAGFGVLAALAILGVAVFTFGDAFSDRLATQGFASDDRLAVYRLGLLSISDAPLFGFGWGTFQQVLPMYRDSSLGPFGVWDLAHNTYIELFQGLGVPAAALFVLGIAVLFLRCARAALTRGHSAIAPLVATSATFIVFLHAFVDFSLQMQAVTLTWAALLAAGVAQSWGGREITDR